MAPHGDRPRCRRRDWGPQEARAMAHARTLVHALTTSDERIAWLRRTPHDDGAPFLVAFLAQPGPEDLDQFLTTLQSPSGVYEDHGLLRGMLAETAFDDLVRRRIRLVDALERCARTPMVASVEASARLLLRRRELLTAEDLDAATKLVHSDPALSAFRGDLPLEGPPVTGPVDAHASVSLSSSDAHSSGATTTPAAVDQVCAAAANHDGDVITEQLASALRQEFQDDDDETRDDQALNADAVELKQRIPTAAPASTAEGELLLAYGVGERVEVRYHGRGRYYPGRIARVHGATRTYDVQYDDGDSEENVQEAHIRQWASPSTTAEAPTATSNAANTTTTTPAPVDIGTSASVTSMGSFGVGDRVAARFRGWQKYFPGEIAAVLGGGLYSVRYADGDFETEVRADLIRPLVTGSSADAATTKAPVAHVVARYHVGDPVRVRRRGGQQASWSPGRVLRSHGDGTYDVEFGDDHEVDCNVLESLIREMDVPDPVAAPEAAAEKEEEEADDEDDQRGGGRGTRRSSRGSQSSASVSGLLSAASSASSLLDASLTLPFAALDAMIRIEDRATKAAPDARSETPAGDDRQYLQLRIGDRVQVAPAAIASYPATDPSGRGDIGWVVAQDLERATCDVLYDDGRRVQGVDLERLRRMSPRDSLIDAQVPTTSAACGEREQERSSPLGASLTPVLPFRSKTSASRGLESGKGSVGDCTQDLDSDNQGADRGHDDDDDEKDGDDGIVLVTARIPHRPGACEARPSTATATLPRKTPQPQRRPITRHASSSSDSMSNDDGGGPAPPRLSASTLRYLSPQPQMPRKTPRGQTPIARTPRGISSGTSQTPTAAAVSKAPVATGVPSRQAIASWKELEEWKNVDLILTRKRRIVASHGQVEGSQVPWGEEFAAIQSLKRFAAQYPEVLREHIECQLQAVVRSTASVGGGAKTPQGRSGAPPTAAARDALLLVKDLAFLLRHRLGPFLEAILPSVLPAVFHADKRFLCDTAYEVLEALVAHCSSRRLALALLRQAVTFPRDDLRLVNLTCLYVEKCLGAMGAGAIEELVARSAPGALEAIAELLQCKSAPAQISLQKALVLLHAHAPSDLPLARAIESHLAGTARELVLRHLELGSAPSPKKKPEGPSHTPLKAPPTASILQRMLAQRQNRVVPLAGD